MAATPAPGPSPLYPQVARKTYAVTSNAWDLNAGGLYSFKVVPTDQNGLPKPYLNFHSLEAPSGTFEEFVLPINPSALQISIPFATNLTATTGGVLEESNGVVFRTIQITGTFGVAARKSVGMGPYTFVKDLRTTPTQSTLGRALTAAGSLGVGTNTLAGIAATVAGAAAVFKAPSLQSGVALTDVPQLGHSQINDLLNYFVAYTELKKTDAGSGARMIFINRKDGVTYVVTPISFDTTKEAADPHLTRYRVVLRAWDLTTSFGGLAQGSILATVTDRNVVAAAANALVAARSVVCAAQGTLRGTVLDFDVLIKTVNQATLLAKGAAQLPVTLAELDGPTGLLSQKGTQLVQALQAAGASATQLRTNVLNLINPSRLPSSASSTATNNTNAQLLAWSNPLLTPEQRLSLVDVLANINIASVQFTQAEQAIIKGATQSAAATTIQDLDAMRATFETARDSLEDAIGQSDPTANAAAGRVAGPKLRDPSPEDYITLASFDDLVAAVDAMGATRSVASQPLKDPFTRAQTNANNPDVTIGDWGSAFPVPFPAGGTLEQLATQYLGDPDAWIDIAVANQLQPPYVDETGFIMDLVSNGNQNSVIVASSTNLYVGQTIYLTSSAQTRQSRLITGIYQLPSGSALIQLNGPANLNIFTVAQGAQLQAYLPGTVNSSMTILIPTATLTSGTTVPNTRVIPLLAGQTQQLKAMGVDLLLDTNFNIALDSTGDINLASGLVNAIQAIRLKLSVEKGSLLHHTDFGLGIQIGTRTITSDSVRTSIENAILGDERFSAIPSLLVDFTGDQVAINMTVQVAGGGNTIPLAFTIS